MSHPDVAPPPVAAGPDHDVGPGPEAGHVVGAGGDLGPGVEWDIYVVQVDSDNGLVGAAHRNADGTVIGTGINLSF